MKSLIIRAILMFTCIGGMQFSIAQSNKNTATGLTIYSDFPGGNILVDSIVGDQIYIHQDINGIWDNWFYWNFKVKGAIPDKTYTFNFTHPWDDVKKMDVIGVNGPTVSLDEGNTWQWMGKEGVGENTFTYKFPANTSVVQFSLGIPYTEANYRKFMDRYKNHPNVYERGLTVSEGGRKVERLHIGKVAGNPKYKVLITARHHSCEMMANFLLEGLISSVLDGDTKERAWLRDSVEFLIIPFMDKDGVEEGRQGKNQRPRDHNSDYKGESLWTSVSALKSFVPMWSQGKLVMALDIHCPGHRGKDHEKIYQVGSHLESLAAEQQIFASVLEKSLDDSLPYQISNDLKFGTSWNKSVKGSRFSDWVQQIKSVRLVSTFEVPYSNASGTAVTEDKTRAFGRDLASAISGYLQQGAISTQEIQTTTEQQVPKSTGLSSGVEGWVRGRTNYYTKNLGLNAQQSNQIYEFLTETAKRGAEIRERLTGDEQKKASWQNGKEFERKMRNILSAEQKQKLKELK